MMSGAPGRYQEAYRGFVQLQKLQPKNHELFVAAGQAQQALGNAENALDEYQKAISAIDTKVLCLTPCVQHWAS